MWFFYHMHIKVLWGNFYSPYILRQRESIIVQVTISLLFFYVTQIHAIQRRLASKTNINSYNTNLFYINLYFATYHTVHSNKIKLHQETLMRTQSIEITLIHTHAHFWLQHERRINAYIEKKTENILLYCWIILLSYFYSSFTYVIAFVSI